MKSMRYNKLILVEKHFRLNGQDFDWNGKLTVREKNWEKKALDDVTVMIETHKDE